MRHTTPFGSSVGPLAFLVPLVTRAGALAVALCNPAPAAGQVGEPLSLSVRPADGVARAELIGVLAGRATRSSLEAGLPVRLLVVTELWRDRFFDSQEGRHEWRATVRYDPLDERYRIETAEGAVLQAGTPEEADALLSRNLRIPLEPDAPGRYYYLGRMEVETLSLSDLEELRHWLQGDLGPAMDRNNELGSALGRGLRRILVRALGLPMQRFEARTQVFAWEG